MTSSADHRRHQLLAREVTAVTLGKGAPRVSTWTGKALIDVVTERELRAALARYENATPLTPTLDKPRWKWIRPAASWILAATLAGATLACAAWIYTALSSEASTQPGEHAAQRSSKSGAPTAWMDVPKDIRRLVSESSTVRRPDQGHRARRIMSALDANAASQGFDTPVGVEFLKDAARAVGLAGASGARADWLLPLLSHDHPQVKRRALNWIKKVAPDWRESSRLRDAIKRADEGG